ncbi:DUF6318 family protein [Ruania alba]|uniref:DUF6318 family protein n=1 Tax=Ruania alba TaxID=648782 RepID=UPI0011144388|nr:DUF6318 family protein [Ruania alba]
MREAASEEVSSDPQRAGSAYGAEPTRTPAASIPTVDAPLRPEVMGEESLDGAEAAAAYIVDLMLYARASGDMTELEQICAPECAFCDDVRRMVTGLEAEGSVVISDGFRSRVQRGSLEYDTVTGEAQYVVILDISFLAETTYDARGGTRILEPYGLAMGFQLEWTPEGWQLHDAGQA